MVDHIVSLCLFFCGITKCFPQLLLWMECLCLPLKLICWNLKSQSDIIWRWGLCKEIRFYEVMRVDTQIRLVSLFKKEGRTHSTCDSIARSFLSSNQEADSMRNQIQVDFGLFRTVGNKCFLLKPFNMFNQPELI